ncbi:MAG: hypothetical protein JJV95_03665 [Sulfurospirillum sp.]|nr:hypothetical protein [Sulfurospirillum sp.]
MIYTFLKDIEIKQYKCFKNFNVNGLKRINLIGGKNNIGKTAFLEACYLYYNSFNIIRTSKDYKIRTSSALLNNNREYLNFKILELMLFIEQTRKQNNFYIDWIREEFDFTNFPEFEINVKDECSIILKDNLLTLDQIVGNGFWNYGAYDVSDFRNNKNFSHSQAPAWERIHTSLIFKHFTPTKPSQSQSNHQPHLVHSTTISPMRCFIYIASFYRIVMNIYCPQNLK